MWEQNEITPSLQNNQNYCIMERFIKIVTLILLLSACMVLNAQEQDTIKQSVNKDLFVNDSMGDNDELTSDNVIKTIINIKLELEKELEVMSGKVDSLTNTNDSLQKLVAKLEPGWKCVLREMAEDVNQLWLDKTYDQLDSTQFVQELALYEKYKGDDKGVGEAYEKLKALCDNYMVYLEGMRAVNNPYDATKVENLKVRFKELVSKEDHLSRKEELNVIYEQLSGYNFGVAYFKNIIIDAENELDEFTVRAPEKVWKQIRVYFEEQEKDIEENITIIPWLKTQYESYIESLKKDPYGYNEAAEAIKKLETL